MTDPERAEAAAELFSDAREVPIEKRGAFLDRACCGDALLRAEVDSLLQAFDAAEEFFNPQRTAAIPLELLDSLPDSSPRGPVGAYRVVRLIATGGMGSVFLGERADLSFRRQVAIKLLRPGLGGPKMLSRFRTERQVLADLQHPGIAHLIDGGSTPDGLPYLVMEYVDGSPITDFCREKQLPLEERLRLFLEVCEAVQYAHANLIIHRDLKPSNILVDRSGRARLLDFGIAKVLEPGPGLGGGGDTLTELRAFTPRYASPEQVRGSRMTTSTDIYSLGVVLYELLAGCLPYAVDAKSAAESERVICEEPPTRPSRAAAEPRVARRLRGDLDIILLRALAKEPDRRYPTVEEFAADIRRHLAGLPVQARPDTAAYRLAKFARRNRVLVGSVGAIVLILAGALAVTLREYHQAVARTREAQWQAYVSSLAAAELSILNGEVEEAARNLDRAPAYLRGWEWRHLHARLDRSTGSWQAHRAGITAIRAAAGGRAALSSSVDSTVKLWDVGTGRLLRTWGPFGSGTESVAQDSAEGLLAAGLSDGTVLLMPSEGGGRADTLTKGSRWAMVDFSPDGRRLAAGFMDGSVQVWDVRARSLLAHWKPDSMLALVAYSRDGRVLVTAGAEGGGRLWDAHTQAPLGRIEGHSRRIYALAVSPSGSLLATGSMDHTARVWDLARRKLVSTFHGHRGTVGPLAFDRTGTRIVSTSADGRTLMWDAASGRLLAELRGHRVHPTAAAAGPDGSWILTGDWGGGMKRWDWDVEDVRTLAVTEAMSERAFTPQARQVAVDPSGGTLVCAAELGAAPLWSADSRKPVRSLPLYYSTRAAFGPDGRRLVAGLQSGEIVECDPRGGAVERSVHACRGWVLGLSVDPHGRRIATSSDDSLVRLWSYPDLRPLRVLKGHRGAVQAVEFSPSGDQLASCGDDSTIRMWDSRTGKLLLIVSGHGGPVEDVAFSPDGTWLVSASEDGTVRMWNAVTGAPGAVLLSGKQKMSAVAVSGDGSRVAAGGSDGIVRLFESRSGREVMSLRGHLAAILSLRFSPRDRSLLSSSADGTVRVWDAAP